MLNDECCSHLAFCLWPLFPGIFFPHGFSKEMQSTPASGEFINTWEEALKGNGRLAPDPFAWKGIWSRDLLLPEQV